MKNTLFALLMAAVALQSCSTAKKLQQNTSYKTGYSIVFEQETKTDTETKIMGQTSLQESQNTSTYLYKVTAVKPDGNIDWETIVTRVSMQENAEGQVSSYDSDDPDRDTLNLKNKMIGKMVGHTLYMTTKSDGKVVAFSGATELFKKMLADFEDKPEMASFSTAIKNAYSDSSMMQTVGTMWGFLPDYPVRVGQQWKNSRTVQGLLNMNVDYQYKLRSRDNKTATILTSSELKTDPLKPMVLEIGEIKISYNLKGSGTGKTIVSQPDGVLLQATHTIKMTGEMQIKGEALGNMVVPISSTTTVTTRQLQPK
jgi:hypothetical protein